MVGVQRVFPYLVDVSTATGSGCVPTIEFYVFDPTTSFEVCGLNFIPLKLEYGPNYFALGFRFGNVAYVSDASLIPPEIRALMQGCLVLIIDVLRLDEPHISHLSAEQALEEANLLNPRPLVVRLIGMAHSIEHDAGNAFLKEKSGDAAWDVKLGFDGERIRVSSVGCDYDNGGTARL
eukprot:gnl/Hemi2/26886_TR9050_c0_g1_i1.p1 gnl/Hemi2/26886_TR9050_c0_g1~~gnl/Hemi2/26886_TR9050_c0_g1_i1.p1  ORF type:complete len:178 (-),score=10.50 gnl/Hemi2/26886_TR9050_c0_g1_i1:50-583(-)